MSAPFEPLRDVIGRAIYEEPARDSATPDWYALSEERREGWRLDADRVIAALASPVGCTPRMEQAAHDLEAVDWLAASPSEVFAVMVRTEQSAPEPSR